MYQTKDEEEDNLASGAPVYSRPLQMFVQQLIDSLISFLRLWFVLC